MLKTKFTNGNDHNPNHMMINGHCDFKSYNNASESFKLYDLLKFSNELSELFKQPTNSNNNSNGATNGTSNGAPSY